MSGGSEPHQEPYVLATLVVDGSAAAPQAERPIAAGYDPRKTYSVPTQFSLGAILVFTTGFALLFAFSRAIDAQPFLELAVAPLLFFVACAQWLCNRIRRGDLVRIASTLSGAVWLLVSTTIAMMFETRPQYEVATLACLLIPSLMAGYAAGGVVASVFLFGALVDHWWIRLRGKRGD